MSDAIRVPLLDLLPQYASIRDEIDAALRRVVESQQFVLGPEVAALEEELAAALGVRRVVGCASGSDALLLALAALGVGPGDEVLCPAFSFFATAGSVWHRGARPVFVDIDPATYNLDVEAARKAAARCTRLKAILPVHLYGQVADLAALEALAADCGVPLVEDAAQAVAARDADGLVAGTRGRVGCFSLFPSKNLAAFGDAGFLTTQDDDLAEALSSLRVHGGREQYLHLEVGFNSRLDALQAAVVRVKLRHLDEWTKARAENAAFYDRRFVEAGAGRSGDAAGAALPLQTPRAPAAPARHVYNQYVIRVRDGRRDALRAHLAARGIGTQIYYPLGLHLQPCFASLGHREGDLPETEAASRETLALPVYPELTREQREHVADSVLAFFRA